MKKVLLFLAFVITCLVSIAQDFSNKGKDFWLGYGYHVRFKTGGGGGGNNGQDMVLYFATENVPGTVTNIKIEIPALGYVENITNVAPGTIAESAPIPKAGAQDARLVDEGAFNRGIHVTSSRPVVAYAHIYNGNVSGATLLFPTNTLGKEYYSINYTQTSNEDFSNSFFYVVAADTGVTTVEITPSAQTLQHAANVPFTVTLNQGEIYNVMGELNGGTPGNYSGADLTGSKIRSISTGAGGCKKIAVFSGAGKMKISCGGANSSDNLIAQAFPKIAWGKKFLTAPTRNMPFNYFRIAVSDPAAIVKVNGTIIGGLINNFYYDLPLTDQPQLIESDQQIMVAQYITTTASCGNNPGTSGGGQDVGDPEMIYLSPVEQTIDEVIVNSTFHSAISANQHWINVVIKTVAVPSFTITGALVPPVFVQHPGDPAFSYAQIQVALGTHTLSADSGFNAIAYGYGGFESYGYNAGTNLKDLYNFIEPLNPLNISGTNSACACTPFYLTVTYPFQPISLFVDFKGFQTPNASITNPVADSTYQINGKQVWRYKFPTPYTYCPAGNYPISITAGTPGTDGCGNLQVKEDTLLIRNTPTPRFTWVNNGCVTDSVRFADSSVYDPGVYSYLWSWDFGDGNTSTEHNPVHKYAAPGTYSVRFSLTTNIGCISTTLTRRVTVGEIPVANFGVSSLRCIDRPISFSDSSSVLPPSVLTRWVWDYGDGSTETNPNGNAVHTYLSAGPKTVTLRVETSSGCPSLPISRTFSINPSPVADFTMPAGVCLPYESAQFADASTIADGSQSSFALKWTFGEPSSGVLDTSILKNPSHLYSSTGPFNVTLNVTSAAGCTADTIKVFSNVYAKASAGITVNAENCLNVATPFSSTSNGRGNAISTWYWDFGDGTPVANGQNVSHTYSGSGSYIVKHWIQTDKGCFSDTAQATVVINALPAAAFTISAPACERNAVTITDQSTTASGNIVQWTWNFGNGRPDSIISAGLPFTYQYAQAGSYNIQLSLRTDKGCVTALPLSRALVVNPLPKPGFISPEVCLSDASAIFTDTSSIASGSIAGWAWNFGDPSSLANNTSTLQNPLHKYNAIGNYTAVLVLTSNAGCKDSITQQFKVNGDIPKSNFTIVAPAICAYDSIRIADSSKVNFGDVTKVEIYWDVVNAPGVVEVDDLPVFRKTYSHLYAAFQSPLTRNVFIKYKAYSGATCVDSITKMITLHAVPKLQFNNIASLCLDAAPYQITEVTEIGGVPGTGVYTGTAVSSTGLFNPATAGVGTFNILYTYTSAFGCVDTASNWVKVLAPAVANFGYSKPSCSKNNIQFTDSSSVPAGVGTIVNRAWDFGDGSAVVNSATNAPVSHTFASSNTFLVSLTITTSNGCKVTVQKPVVVNPLPVPAFRFPPSSCLPNAEVAFTDNSTIADGTENSLTYLWNFDDPSSGSNTSRSKNPTHVFTVNRVYNVQLLCTSNNGCTDSVVIRLNTLHPQPSARFSADSTSICEGQSVQFQDISNGADGTVTNWTWDFGNSNQFIGKVPGVQTYTNANVYTIKLEIENSWGCKDDTTIRFTVYANPVVSAGEDKVLLEGGELNLEATATGNGLQYTWLPATFLNNNRIIRPLVKGLNQDEITYTLEVVAAGGCKNTDQVVVTLLKAPVIPNTFTPNGDGINDNWTILYLDSYPECKIRVFSRDGQSVYEKYGYSAPGWDGKYNGKQLPFGTYYYVIEPGSGRKPMTGYVTLLY